MIQSFKSLCSELSNLIEVWENRLTEIPPELVAEKQNRQQRSIRQIVGHMVDSATNNTHRIIHMQYQDSPVNYPDYANLGNNDRWIAIQNYQDEDWALLVSLWAASNRHIVHVIGQVDPSHLGKIWISATSEEVNLEEMILDYPRHFKLHLGEIDDLINQ
jgi:hypothetical protein